MNALHVSMMAPRTRAGLVFDYADPSSYPVVPLELFQTAQQLPRWGGRLDQPVTLLEHLALCLVLLDVQPAWRGDTARRVAPYLAAHDLHEVVMLDVPRPLKQLLPDYQALEARWMEHFHRALGLDWPVPADVAAIVKSVDELAALVELDNAAGLPIQSCAGCRSTAEAHRGAWFLCSLFGDEQLWVLVARTIGMQPEVLYCDVCGSADWPDRKPNESGPCPACKAFPLAPSILAEAPPATEIRHPLTPAQEHLVWAALYQRLRRAEVP